MKRIFKISVGLCLMAAVSLSCMKEGEPLASGLTLDKTEISAEGTSADEVTVKVSADGDWFAIAPEWVEVTPSVGSGETEVKLKIADNLDSFNELAGPRSGFVSFCYGTNGISALIVNQKGEAGLDSSRQYSKVTKEEDIVAGGSYLIAFSDGSKVYALKPFNASKEDTYSYLFADEVTDKAGVVETQNANNAFLFVGAEGGFRLKMSNGRYLFQNASYNNFYSTTDESKGDIWTVKMNENGIVTITNVTVAGKYIQYSSNYGSAGAYGAAQDGALLPILYKDSKPASTEVLIVPESASVTSESTTASISVTSNATWKVRCHDGWIKTFTKSGKGDGKIELTFDTNASKTEDRTATLLVIGETSNFTIKFTQNKVATTIAQLVGQITSKDKSNPSPYSVDLTENATAVVSYVNGGNVYIEDETGAILLYLKNSGLKEGQKVSGKISGTGYIFNGLPQITSIEGATYTDGGKIPCTEVTLSELLKNYNGYMSRRVLVKGVTVSEAFNNRNGKVKDGDNEIAVRASSTSLKLPEVGKKGDILVYPAIYNKTKQLTFYADSDFKVAE